MATRAARRLSDKPTPDEVEDASVGGVRLSNPDKVLYPQQGVTKRELAEYLDAVAPRMLPHVRGRLLSLVRCPQGRAKKCFFQRHGGAGLSTEFRQLDVTESRSGDQPYLYIENKAGLIAAAQMGVLELHIWGSRIDDVNRPDRMVFDLDPDPSVGFAQVKEAAFRTRDALDELGLRSFVLLTGGKGVHVVAPLRRQHGWATVKAFARALAERFVEDDPGRYVATMAKAKRKGRVFIDFFRNDRTATAIAPYSPRAREGAAIAWPVTWADLERADAANIYRLRDVNPTGPDPWADYADVRQGLKASSLRALDVSPE